MTLTGKEIIQELRKTELQFDEDSEYCDAEEFAAMYGYSPSSIRQMLMRKQISGAVKLGNKWMIDKDASVLVRQNTKKRKIKL